MILLVKDDSQDVWSVTLPCVGRSEGFKDGVQRWQKKRIASIERLGSVTNCSSLDIKRSFYVLIYDTCLYFIFIKVYFNTETAAVCDRSKFSHGCYRFFISYVCYIVEISVSIYMFFNLVT